MKKRYLPLVALLLAACLLLASACSLKDTPAAEPTAAPTSDGGYTEEQRSAVAVKVGDQTVTLGDVIDTYDSILSMYAYYGVSTPTEASEIESFQDMAVSELVRQKMQLYQAGLMGLSTLSAEDQAAVQTNYDEEIDSLMESFRSYAIEDGATEDTADAKAVELINDALIENGWNLDYDGYKEWLMKSLTEEKVLASLETAVKESITLSEEELASYYTDQLAADKEQFASTPADYLDIQEGFEMSGGTPALVVPEGYVRVKVLSIPVKEITDEGYTALQNTVAALEQEFGKLSLAASAEETRLAEIRTEYAEALAKIEKEFGDPAADAKAKAEEAYQKLAAGASFDDVLLEYGSDELYGTYETIKAKGRLMLPGAEDGWNTALHDAAQKLADGAHSEIVFADNVYYILQRVGLEAAGERTLEEVRKALEPIALGEKQESAWETKVEEWVADESLITYFEDVYRSVGK